MQTTLDYNSFLRCGGELLANTTASWPLFPYMRLVERIEGWAQNQKPRDAYRWARGIVHNLLDDGYFVAVPGLRSRGSVVVKRILRLSFSHPFHIDTDLLRGLLAVGLRGVVEASSAEETEQEASVLFPTQRLCELLPGWLGKFDGRNKFIMPEGLLDIIRSGDESRLSRKALALCEMHHHIEREAGLHYFPIRWLECGDGLVAICHTADEGDEAPSNPMGRTAIRVFSELSSLHSDSAEVLRWCQSWFHGQPDEAEGIRHKVELYFVGTVASS